MNYTKDNIKVLNDIEHIRKRKSLYIGESTDPRHLFSEVLDNAMDEMQGGYGDKIVVDIDTHSNRYTIQDFGRGIPHGTKTLEDGSKIEVLKLLSTKLNSGGKFNRDAYLMSSGLHGQGLTLVNALSSTMEIYSRRERSIEYYNASEDIFKHEDYDKEDYGTTISFIPNPEYFDQKTIPLDYILNRCRICSAVGAEVSLTVDGVCQDVKYSLEDLIPKEYDLHEYAKFPIINSSDNKKEERMSVLLKYTSDTKDKYYGYTNLLYNSMGGTHVNFISGLLSEVWEKYIQSSKIQLQVPLHKSDYLIGLRCIVMAYISEPEFSSQTKERLSVKKDYFNIFKDKLISNILFTMKSNDKQARALVKRFEEYRIAQNKLLSRKEISSLIQINEDNPDNIRRRSVVENLIECTSRNRKNTELYIVEGNSAVGPVTRTRNKELQAGLPLRGKVLNVAGMEVKKALKSEVIRNIVSCIGCGIGSMCDSSKSRYERILIVSDSDPDGSHIQNLIITTFVNLLPDIVKDGRLYIVEPPFYMYTDKDGKHFTSDRDAIPKNVSFERFKGLGSMNDDAYKLTIMNPKYRKMYQVQYPSDIDRFNKIMGTGDGKSDVLKELGILKNMRG